MDNRYASSPAEVAKMNTEELRKNFLIENIFEPDKIHLTQTYFDRFIVGGAMPVNERLTLPVPAELRAEHFLDRREMGIINVGGEGSVEVDDEKYSLNYKDALYIGKGSKKVVFYSGSPDKPAKFYINSAPAHQSYPTSKVTKKEAEIAEMGSLEASNHRTINKLLVASVIDTCQLQLGMTELKTGSVWNTMPAHTHDRRMEVYFYFEIPEGQSVCHFMGQPQETRHIWMQNEQAVISPQWSIHAGSGTSNYTFIWGMAGENLDYGDMDKCEVSELR